MIADALDTFRKGRWSAFAGRAAAVLTVAALALAGCAGIATVDDSSLPAVTAARLGALAGGQIRLSLETAHPVGFRVLTTDSPYRVAVEFSGLRPPVGPPATGLGIVQSYRFEPGGDGVTRVVLDLGGPVRVDQARFAPNRTPATVGFTLDLTPISRAEFVRDQAHGRGVLGEVRPVPRFSGRKPEPGARRPPLAAAGPGVPAVVAGAPRGGPPWTSRPYSHFSRDQEVADVLRDLAASQGIPIVVSDKARGTVNGAFEAYQPQRLFDELVRTYGLIWYFEGTTLHVYAATEATSRIIRLRGVTPAQLKTRLVNLGLWDARYPWRESPADSLIAVSGPPGLVEQVSRLAREGTGEDGKTSIRVFPLRYAWADDRVFHVRDREVKINGVATLLQRLLSKTPGSDASGSGVEERHRPATHRQSPQAGMLNEPRPAQPAGEMDPAAAALVVDSTSEITPPGFALPDSSAPTIVQADARTNTVIVRGPSSVMAALEEAIGMLDKPVKLVEIEVLVMDVNSTYARDLGIDWRVKEGNVNVGWGTITDANPASGVLSLAGGPAAQFSTLLTASANSVLARVKALETNGNARILTRPSIMTMNNMEALIDDNQTFYVRVAGRDAVDLFPITVGTMLKVTPSIQDADGTPSIQLLVDVEDGGVDNSAQPVDQIPQVKKSEIRTQAVVGQNESLLIGGITRQSDSATVSKLPLLGDIPVIGWALFGTLGDKSSTADRMFLITPRLVTL